MDDEHSAVTGLARVRLRGFLGYCCTVAVMLWGLRDGLTMTTATPIVFNLFLCIPFAIFLSIPFLLLVHSSSTMSSPFTRSCVVTCHSSHS